MNIEHKKEEIERIYFFPNLESCRKSSNRIKKPTNARPAIKTNCETNDKNEIMSELRAYKGGQCSKITTTKRYGLLEITMKLLNKKR